ncbi:MAG TPA: hypothetical protein VGB72_07515 [Acidobacteriota bacterium]
MKKALGIIFFSLAFSAALSAEVQPWPHSTASLSIRLYGGLNFLSGGELNKAAEGYGTEWADLFEGGGYTVSGKFAPAHLGMNFGGEFIFQFSPNMAVGLGAEYIQSSKSSALGFSPALPPLVEVSWEPEFSAIPIAATFYFFLPSGGSLKFFLNAGLGYYLAKAGFNHNWWFIVPIHWEAKTTGGGLGFHGGVGLELGLSPLVGIIAEVKGRYASFSNFEGSVHWSFPGYPGTDYTVDGNLWAFDSDGKTFVWLDSVEPAGDDPRQAKVDFSGFSFLAGIIIHF